jgi:cytochrome c biogenesis protein CcdA
LRKRGTKLRAGFDFVIGAVTGVAWVAAAGGAYLGFVAMHQQGIAAAISAAMLGLVPGFLAAIFLEAARRVFETADESRRQRELLEKILEKLSDNQS